MRLVVEGEVVVAARGGKGGEKNRHGSHGKVAPFLPRWIFRMDRLYIFCAVYGLTRSAGERTLSGGASKDDGGHLPRSSPAAHGRGGVRECP